jgi:hypothetical protein
MSMEDDFECRVLRLLDGAASAEELESLESELQADPEAR